MIEQNRNDSRSPESTYRDMFESAVAGMFQTTIPGLFRMANSAMAHILGYDSPEHLISSVTDIGRQLYIRPEERIEEMCLVQQHGSLAGVERQLCKRDGSRIWVQMDERLVRDADGAPLYYEGSLIDITERKRAQESLASQTKELLALNTSLQKEIAERRRAEQISVGQTTALTRIVTLLAGEPELDKFLGQVLQALAEQLFADSAAFWFFDEETQTIEMHLDYAGNRVLTRRESNHPLAMRPVPIQDLAWWSTLVTSRSEIRPTVFTKVNQDPILTSSGVAEDLCWMTIPLVFNERLIGVLAVLRAAPVSSGSGVIELAQALAEQATLAVIMTRLASQQQQSAVLEERNRFAQEIHDTLAQDFTGIVVQLEAAEEVLAEDSEARSYISRARTLARKGLTEARRSVWSLSPLTLQQNNLMEALQELVGQYSSDPSIKLSLKVEGTVARLPGEAEFNLLRICQEAVTNAIRHGRPNFVEVRIDFTDESVIMNVIDNGGGFANHNGTEHRGFGLISMHDRAQRIGGDIEIESVTGEGTRITVVVPRGISTE